MGYTIREMMAPCGQRGGIVGLDEKYLGGHPHAHNSRTHKRGRITAKQCVLIDVERHGSVRSVPVAGDSIAALKPVMNSFVATEAHLMCDEHRPYVNIDRAYRGHCYVTHRRG